MKSVCCTETFSHKHTRSLGLKWKMSHTQSWHGCPMLHSTWLISLFHLLWFMVSDDRPLGCYRWTECLSNPSKWQTHPHPTSPSNKTQLTVLIKEHKPCNHMSTHKRSIYSMYEMGNVLPNFCYFLKCLFFTFKGVVHFKKKKLLLIIYSPPSSRMSMSFFLQLKRN